MGDAQVEIKVRDNGPYKVTGPVTIIDAERNRFPLPEAPMTIIDAERNRFPLPEAPIALCRCGRSQTKPFCDASHKAGFEACERAGG